MSNQLVRWPDEKYHFGLLCAEDVLNFRYQLFYSTGDRLLLLEVLDEEIGL